MSSAPRRIGSAVVYPVGLGCMNISHAYGRPLPAAAARELLAHAVDIGVTHFDCAALYGFGRSEELLGEVLPAYRTRIHIASKCGMTGIDGRRVIDGRPETLQRTLEESLRRLRTDVIDLYYLHRWDKRVPIEDSVGALRDMVAAGKVRDIGLCEVSAATLRRAHAVHPISAVQSEYSLWTRNVEVAVLRTCSELGAALVAFAPIARGFLGGSAIDPGQLEPNDLRRTMPRFQGEHWERNRTLLGPFRDIAVAAGCTPAQLALAWLLQKAEQIVPIPGTTTLAHLGENVAAARVRLAPEHVALLEQLVNPQTVSGARYALATQLEIDTEELGDPQHVT